tara:strand:+ start:265 stop:504 length:240 start_codon:yes stop_codon:yes gene_type:complete
MSLAKVSSSVSNLTQFIKEKTISNLLESSRSGDLDLDEETLKKVNRIIDLSVSQAFTLGYGSVETALTEFEKKSRANRG